MVSRGLRRLVAVACLLACTNCAVLNYRGGFVAQVEDVVLFHATTKSHRLLRSYLLIGGLTAIASNMRLNGVERGQVGGAIQTAVKLARETYLCLYPERWTENWDTAPNSPINNAVITVGQVRPVTSCIFFDNRMAQLDYAIYKLAAAVLLDAESETVAAMVRNRMVGEFPVIGRAVRTVSKAVDTASEAAGTIYDATQLLNALVNVSYRSGDRWLYIAPIYRDVLEFDMRLVLQSLRYKCGVVEGYPALPDTVYCDSLREGENIFNNGNGHMEAWRTFLKASLELLDEVEAYPLHFAIATRWVYQSCAALFSPEIEPSNEAVIKAVGLNCGPLPEFVPIKTTRMFRVKRGPAQNDTEDLTARSNDPSRFVAPSQRAPLPQNATPLPRKPPQGTTGAAAQ